MEFESPDVEREFPGLYASESGRRSDGSEFSDDSQKVSKKDLLIGKRKDKKDSKKDRGYATLEGESSPEEDADVKSPSKSKKSKTFKFTSKKEKREKSREKEVKEKDNDKDKDKKKSDEKDKEKKKEKVKLKLKDKKKSKQDDSTEIEDMPVFGVPLSVATERSKCHDGVDIPLVVRDCIDHVQQTGLTAENVYKVSAIKSRVQQVKRLYNQREVVSLVDYDLPIATSLLKQFLRELPEPVFTTELLEGFEEAGSVQEVSLRGQRLKSLVDQLPSCNRTLLTWLVKHFDNISSCEKQNKMNAQCIAVTLSPVLLSSQRLISALLCHTSDIFPNITLSKYVPPVRSAECLPVPDGVEAIEEELRKQDSLLEMLHSEMNRGLVSKNREEQLWEVQRIITQLKRKLRSLEKGSGSLQKQSCDETDCSLKYEGEDLSLSHTVLQSGQQQVQTSQPQSGQVQAEFSPPLSPVKQLASGNNQVIQETNVWNDTNTTVSKHVTHPRSDVSSVLNKHVTSSHLVLTPALNQHVPTNIVNDPHAMDNNPFSGQPSFKKGVNPALKRQLSLRLEPSKHFIDQTVKNNLVSPLNRTPSFRNTVSSHLNRQFSFRKLTEPFDVNIALNRHPLFNDHSDPLLIRRPSFRNNVSRTVSRQPSFKNESTLLSNPDSSLVKVQSAVPRFRIHLNQVKQAEKIHDAEVTSVPFPKNPSPILERRKQTVLTWLNSGLPKRNEPTSLPASYINNFKPSASLEVEEINKPLILLVEKKQLAILETEELTNVIINLRALCQLETKEINRIRNKIIDLGGNPDTYMNYLSDGSEEEGVSLPIYFERNGIIEKRKELRRESKRLKHQRDVMLRSICAECETCISLRVQIKLLQMNKSNSQS